MNIVTLCGSLRAASINRMLLRVVRQRAPVGMRIVDAPPLRALPLFDPDLEGTDEHGREAMPAAARALREAIMGSDGVIIASPEYAHGISSVLKTALDWMVSDERFVGKPVLVLNCSPRSVHADAALREILGTMSARLVGDESSAIPLRARGLEEAEILADAALLAAIDQALLSLRDCVLAAADEAAAGS